MRGRNFFQYRLFNAAARHGMRAARVKVATRWRPQRRRNFAFDSKKFGFSHLQFGCRGQQRLGVRVIGAAEHRISRGRLDHTAQIHDDHAV